MSISTAFENFVFRGFNFWDKAKRYEYWIVMPLLWAGILGLLVMDLRDIWQHLGAGEKPSLNPMNYGSFFLFVLTLIPRYALTVRRLNDAGRSPKWALLPVQATVLSLWAVFGIGSALLMSGKAGLTDTGAQALMLGFLSFGTTESLWPAAFAFAQTFEPAHILDLFYVSDLPAVDTMMANAAGSMQNDPRMAGSAMMMAGAMVLGPPLMMMVFVMFMVSPSKLDRFGGMSSLGDYTPPARGKVGSSAMQGYAALARSQAAGGAPSREAARAEVQALYRSRVLKQNPAD